VSTLQGSRGVAARCSSKLRVPQPGLDTVWAAIAVAVPTAAAWLGRTQAVDLAYQVRAGTLMLDTHRVLSTDPFTFSVAGRSWLDQQWGAQVIFGAVWRLGGWDGLAFLWGLMVGATAWCVFLACRSSGANPVCAALLTLAGFVVGLPILTLRPQLIGILLFGIAQWVIASRHRAPARLWLVPALVVVWANVHGSFILAFALLGFAWLDDRATHAGTSRRLMIVGGVSAVATLLNPFGGRVWTYVADTVGNPTVAGRVAEWAPPSVREPAGLLFFGSVLGFFAIVATTRGRASWRTLLAASFFALLGITAIRGVVWWSLAFPPLLAPSLGGVLERPNTRSWANAALLLGLACLLVVALPLRRGEDAGSGGPDVLTFAPQDLVEAVADAVPPGSHVFASEVYGSWIEFAAPQLPVFVDPRIELFPAGVWDDYFAVSSGRADWEEILDELGVRGVIVHRAWASGLLDVIDRSPEWRLVASSGDGYAYVRV